MLHIKNKLEDIIKIIIIKDLKINIKHTSIIQNNSAVTNGIFKNIEIFMALLKMGFYDNNEPCYCIILKKEL